MQCASCHQSLNATVAGFVVCPHCGEVNLARAQDVTTAAAVPVAQEPVQEPIQLPTPPKKAPIFAAKNFIIGGLAAFVLLFLSVVSLAFYQNAHASALVKSAKQNTAQGKYDEAQKQLIGADNFLVLDGTKKQISQAKNQNKLWQADATKLQKSLQLVTDGKYDEASALLAQINANFPDQSKVKALQTAITNQKVALAQKAADNKAKADAAAAAAKTVAPPTKKVAAPAPSASAAFTTPIKINGDAACQSANLAALKLLSDKAPKHYANVIKYIGVIECVSQGSGMLAYENPPKYLVGDVTRNAGTLWLAGTIAHDAGHSKLYHDYLDAHPGSGVPADIWTGEAAERTCLAAQADALSQMGAPQSTIDYVNNVINTQYYNVPYDQRWW